MSVVFFTSVINWDPHHHNLPAHYNPEWVCFNAVLRCAIPVLS